jgi:hypothetical protein
MLERNIFLCRGSCPEDGGCTVDRNAVELLSGYMTSSLNVTFFIVTAPALKMETVQLIETPLNFCRAT